MTSDELNNMIKTNNKIINTLLDQNKKLITKRDIELQKESGQLQFDIT